MTAQVINIVRGATREFNLRVKNKSDDTPFDFTGLTDDDVTLKIAQDDGNTLTLDLSGGIELVNAAGGLLKITFSAADTALLKEACDQDFQLTILKSGKTYIQIIEDQINVEASLFED